MLFIINGAGLIFPWKNRIFAKEWTKTVKDLHFELQQEIFSLFLKRKNVFLENKKEHSTKK
jgi:hypothetical protein